MSEPREVLLSIHPKFAQAISEGRKTVELRRRFPSLPDGTSLALYATLPLGAVIGRVRVRSVTRLPLDELWKIHGPHAAVSREEFWRYFHGVESGVAISVADYQRLDSPVTLKRLRSTREKFVVPQNYRYIDARWLDALAA